MNCTECSNLLSAHLDGAVSASEEARVTGHLSECAGCRSALRQLQVLKRRLMRMTSPIAREGFWDGIYQQIRQQPHVPSFSWRQLFNLPEVRLPALAAAIVALIMFGISVVLGGVGRQELVSMHPLLAEHARYSVVQPLSDPGRMNFILADSDLSSLDKPVVLVNESQ